MTFEVAKKEDLPLCACGCGQPVANKRNTYVFGHQGRKTAVRQQNRARIDDDGNVYLDQNMELVQQILGRVLKGSKDNNNINIITILNSTTNGHKAEPKTAEGKNEMAEGEVEFYERLARFETLDDMLTEILCYAQENGLMPDSGVDARIAWFTAAERVLAKNTGACGK